MYDLITSFVEPIPLFFSFSGLAIANLWRRRRESRTRLLFVLIPFCLLWFACTSGVAHLALGTLEWRYPAGANRPPNAKAIVVLSGLGNVDPNLSGRAHELLGEITVGRCLYAAELYRKAPRCPMVVSGGNVKPGPLGPTPAEVMRDFLIGQGVGKEHIIVEDHSRTTYENAVASADLLKASNVVEIVLVTDASPTAPLLLAVLPAVAAGSVA